MNSTIRSRRLLAGLAAVVALALVTTTVYAAKFWPEIGAKGSDVLRAAVGDKAVADLEAGFYQARDDVRLELNKLFPAKAVSPWSTAESGSSSSASLPPATANTGLKGILRVLTHSRTGASASSRWVLPDLKPMAATQGEGMWTPYLTDPNGTTVGQKTFLHPDPQRPYAYVAIVAIDLKAAQLHFVLGTDEPASSAKLARPGRIPASDMQPGILLAAFNGGFKARHGQFGAAVDGITVLPPKPGLGTVALYDDGTVRIGAWGKDIVPSSKLHTWRQNGPLLIDNGQVADPALADNPAVWGQILGGKTATWRSGIGLSADGRTLYYAAGPSLTLTSLAEALSQAGAANAIQLDMNDFWVHFDAMQSNGGKLQPQALLSEMKSQSDQRFLQAYSRDFFYVTARS